MYEKFEALLKERDMKVYELVKELAKDPETRIGQSTFSDWKSGRSKPKADKLKILAEYFGVTIEYFLED